MFLFWEFIYPSADTTPVVSIGPTATLAFGRELQRSIRRLSQVYHRNIGLLARQYLMNRGGFRRYLHEQVFGLVTLTDASCSRADTRR